MNKQKNRIAFYVAIVVIVLLFFVCVIFVGKKNASISTPTSTIASTLETQIQNSVNTQEVAYEIIDIKINDNSIKAYLADTESKKELGLGKRKSLDQDTGMIFTFDQPDYYGIWMKDMLFAIDILWLDKNGTVITKKENISPETYPKSFEATALASYVLELPAGASKRYGINLGSTLIFDYEAVR